MSFRIGAAIIVSLFVAAAATKVTLGVTCRVTARRATQAASQ